MERNLHVMIIIYKYGYTMIINNTSASNKNQKTGKPHEYIVKDLWTIIDKHNVP